MCQHLFLRLHNYCLDRDYYGTNSKKNSIAGLQEDDTLWDIKSITRFDVWQGILLGRFQIQPLHYCMTMYMRIFQKLPLALLYCKKYISCAKF